MTTGIAATERIDPNPEMGKMLAREFTAGGTNTEIALDAERLREIAQDWMSRASKAQMQSNKVAEIGSEADGQAGGFREQYRPEAPYGEDYAAMRDGDDAMSERLGQVYASAEALAGGLMWLADNWEDVQSGNVKIVDDVDTDILADAPPRTSSDAVTPLQMPTDAGLADVTASDLEDPAPPTKPA